ncbi:LysR family transcriptional regulator substrate-binding protein [Corynebacterium auris]|uniref:LysR family transcriptional regulator substrate-binding protein n=1 Tax=Corynebacterium auris TaxID=44750 RepID=UPI0025B320D3|nr:LysR family transcriptional regulator substrate-binding protein [Corynebacterium auris]WJY67716.1 LysR substrate binding domain protein [Corynebacterium auris]
MLRLSFVTGTEPGKWLRRYEAFRREAIEAAGRDDPLAELGEGRCDLALVRLPDERVSERHHVVKLYEEAPGVAVPKESVYAEVGGAVRRADLEGEIVTFEFAAGAEIGELRDALQVVAANVGVAFAPRPLLKILAKKQVAALELIDEAAPVTTIALVWQKVADSDAIQDFVGVAKGRTVNSSRGSKNQVKGYSERRSRGSRRGRR